MKQVVIFADFKGTQDHGDPYSEVEEQANEWLAANSEATILASHTNMQASPDWTEFSLTLIVELPEPHNEEATKEQEVLDAIRRNDPAVLFEIIRDTGIAEQRALTIIEKLRDSGKVYCPTDGLYKPA